jgi:hypothetical protein
MLSPLEWLRFIRHALLYRAPPVSKLTPLSRTRSRILIGLKWFFFLSSCVCLIFGLGVALFYAGTQWFPSLKHLPSVKTENPLDWAVFWLALAIITGGILPLWQALVSDEAHNLRSLKDAGKMPRYTLLNRREDEISVPVGQELAPPDIKRYRSSEYNKVLYREYLNHSIEEARGGFKIKDVPVYFVIPPGKAFEVKIDFRYEPLEHGPLSMKAAKEGFDWCGLMTARVARREQESDTRYWEDSLRAVDLEDGEKEVTLTCCQGSYRDYIATELSVDLVYEGVVPNLRHFFEGEAWSNKSVDLRLIKDACKCYAMRVGVAALVATDEGYLVFQRRSEAVETAVGGLAGSGAGAARWSDVRHSWRRQSRKGFLCGLPSLRKVGTTLTTALFREIAEEIGIYESDFETNEKPFMAAALNLKYGRDLNFYAFLESKRTCMEFSFGRNKAQDGWEVAHLIFVPPTAVNEHGDLEPPFDGLLGDSRHLRGLLYSAFRDSRFQELRRKFPSVK